MMQPKNLADDIDTPGMLATLRDQAATVQQGDLSHVEAMLINQASSLQALFVRLSERSMEQSLMPNLEGFMRMALRPQSQCRATLETLATIKNPPIIYAKQANIANGHQQINNGTAAPSHTQENAIEPNELSGGSHELLPDASAQSLTRQVNQAVGTMETIDRAKVARR